jgi:hypothetical protein
MTIEAEAKKTSLMQQKRTVMVCCLYAEKKHFPYIVKTMKFRACYETAFRAVTEPHRYLDAPVRAPTVSPKTEAALRRPWVSWLFEVISLFPSSWL